MIAHSLSELCAWLPSGFCLQLTQALVHFLWQGCLVALAYAVVARALRRASANVRYLTGVAALLAMAACLPLTLWLLPVPAQPLAPATATAAAAPLPTPEIDEPALPSALSAVAITTAPLPAPASDAPALAEETAPAVDVMAPNTQANSFADALRPYVVRLAPYATIAYLGGVAAMLLRVALGLWAGRRLRHACIPITNSDACDLVRTVAQRLRLRIIPTVAYCHRVAAPVVVGVLRPMVLLPLGLAANLTPAQIETILIHEFAHIRRFDLVVNILQRVIEALLFFHPAVWWLSHRVSGERENACDDLVLQSHCGRVQYADALLRMAELAAARRHGPLDRAALAAAGDSSSQFKRRILRLLDVDDAPRLRLTTWGTLGLTGVLVGALLLPLAWQTMCIAQAAPRNDSPAAGNEQPAPSDTAGQRTLHFPADRAMGVLYCHARAEGPYKYPFYGDDWKLLGDAQGDVRVPANADVRLDVGKAASADLSGLDELQPDDVQALNLCGTGVNDQELQHVGRLTGLRELNLEMAHITDAGARHLANLKQLRQIDLSAFAANREGFGVGDEAMKVLGQLPHLESLRLRLTKVSDAGMAALRQAKSLKTISLAGTLVTDAGLAHLQQLPRLERLCLGVYDEGAKITDEGLKTIGKLTTLKSLDLAGTRVTDAGLPYLKDLSHLESLGLDGTRVTNAGLAQLAPLTGLQRLRLYTRKKTDDLGVQNLAKLKSLRTLQTHLQLTEQGVAALAELPQLDDVDLVGDGITDAAVRHLARMKGLKSVSLQHCPVTDEGLAPLAELKNLETVSLFDVRMRGVGIKYLQNLPKLTTLHFTFDYAHHPATGQRPTLLEVGKLSHLENLSVGSKGLYSADLAAITLLKLKYLKVQFGVNDIGATQIAKIATLQHLDIVPMLSNDKCTISDGGLAKLSHLSHLKIMQVNGEFTDRGIQQLAQLKSLEQLYLGSPQVTVDGLQKLAAQLPHLAWARCKAESVSIPSFVVGPKDGLRRNRGRLRAHQDELEDHAPPAWKLTGWLNGAPAQMGLENLRGKVVLVDFWFTGCGPCRKLLPKLKELYAKHQGQGFVIVGVHSTGGAEKMPEYVAKEQIPWPMAVDVANATSDAWEVDGYPGIYLLDRAGKLRVASVADDDIEKAVAMLLAEKTPAAAAASPTTSDHPPAGKAASPIVRGVRFVGNTAVSAERLHTVLRVKNSTTLVGVGVNSDSGLVGEIQLSSIAESKKLQEAHDRLTTYYRSQGFLHARIGQPVLDYNDERQPIRATFPIDEGPRFKIHNVTFIGNTKFSHEELSGVVKLKRGDYFNQAQPKGDVDALRAQYGGSGYVFADIQVEPQFLETPDQIDLVYRITEGSRYRISQISLAAPGPPPTDRIESLLQELPFKQGDIVDTRKLRKFEERWEIKGLSQKLLTDAHNLCIQLTPKTVKGQKTPPLKLYISIKPIEETKP